MYIVAFLCTSLSPPSFPHSPHRPAKMSEARIVTYEELKAHKSKDSMYLLISGKGASSQ